MRQASPVSNWDRSSGLANEYFRVDAIKLRLRTLSVPIPPFARIRSQGRVLAAPGQALGLSYVPPCPLFPSSSLYPHADMEAT
jgi:hypothetical protein